MASSLNHVFSKKIDPLNCYDEEDSEHDEFTSGSETESVPDGQQDDSDDCSTMIPSKKRRTKSGVVASQAGLKQQRNPTRRPNPKISNRNALLARENRKRKKEHVESLEKEVEQLKQYNGQIRKALKKKSKLVEQLTQERNYLKSVIANRTGIMAVLRSVQGAGFPMTSSQLSYVTETMKTPSTGSSCDEGVGSSPHPALFEEEEKFNSNGTAFAQEDPFLASFLIESEFSFPDLGLESEHVLFEDEFSRLPDMDELLSAMGSGPAGASTEQVISSEHNYFEQSNHESLGSGVGETEAGVCIHIVPGGRVSVEFCASCALSSRRAWIEDAQER